MTDAELRVATDTDAELRVATDTEFELRVATDTEFELRVATDTDVDAIRRLEGLSPSTRRLLRKDLARDDRRCLVASTRPGRVVGYAAALVALDEAHVLDLVVDPAARRRGVGRRLLEALLEAVAPQAPDGVTLEVRRSNAAALALYRQRGFVIEGQRPGYYPDGEDALLLWRRPRPDTED
ncbi:ribosomal protein S18-alanine N-acetyltransferase [Egicoccus halophilus]|uniref:Ribosomal-protein-alanine acetyltransferase n=1 Tax=Egicoccus halophilus TaxID=1670830 RepID=A0A8J3A9Z9_9ACTN|nr:ribosomal protein S18-alanine N-acetyltransferase [Egicoccus halophilus]GGI05909.1 ribosomal-protein-alanine acetyltransferase [Egicoccus halophilus]